MIEVNRRWKAAILSLWMAPLAPPAALAAPDAVAAEPSSEACAPAAAKPCIIDLYGRGAPSFSAQCTTDPWPRYVRSVLADKAVDANRDGWWETVLEIALDPARDCGCVRFRIHFEAPVYDWSVNLGDSPTSDGHGGDAGTTFDEAELQIYRSNVTLYSSSRGRGVQAVGRILDTTLPPLAGRYVDLELCDQIVLLEMPGGLAGNRPLRTKVSSPVLGGLFSFTRSAGASSKDRGLYAAFNRVVYLAQGNTGRLGTGVRRVEITLSR